VMGNVVWLTGLSGSGKSTLAESMLKELIKNGSTTSLIDGDRVRDARKKRLSFSRNDIEENGFSVIELCEKERMTNDYVIVAVITPFERVRAEARARLEPSYFEIFVSTSLDVCKNRDTKGEIENLIGVAPNVPFEVPHSSDISIDTAEITIEEGTQMLLSCIEKWLDDRKQQGLISG
jgi:adenylylsulfate kinase-like enzyme